MKDGAKQIELSMDDLSSVKTLGVHLGMHLNEKLNLTLISKRKLQKETKV